MATIGFIGLGNMGWPIAEHLVRGGGELSVIDAAAGPAEAGEALLARAREVRDEVDGARGHYAAKERCVFCDIIRQELASEVRVISANPDFVALSPYAPRFPFETWLLPKRHQAMFEDAPRHEIASLARLLSDVLRRINRALRFPPYNLLIHSAPLGDAHEYYHWHVDIIPKLTKGAGFEWATGFYINPTSPEEAAQVLREARG